jgi:hypothetical protein
MEMSHGNFLYSYLKQKKNVFFFCTKLENKRAKQSPSEGLIPVGGEKRWGKCVGGLIWRKCCVHMYVNGKMIPV